MIALMVIATFLMVAYSFYISGKLQEARADLEIAAIALEYYKETDDAFMASTALFAIKDSREDCERGEYDE